ncbi:hypothetical protein [Streptomyces marincola]|nr:hypothetical protein LC193_13320 [Streptomyces marincola]
MARAIGGSRNGVADGLQRLRAAGAVATARKVISILDPDAPPRPGRSAGM